MWRLSPGTASPFRVTPVARPLLTELGLGDTPSTTWAFSAFCNLSLPSGGSAFRLTDFLEREVTLFLHLARVNMQKITFKAGFLPGSSQKNFKLLNRMETRFLVGF
jgi:hypothetical protein